MKHSLKSRVLIRLGVVTLFAFSLCPVCDGGDQSPEGTQLLLISAGIRANERDAAGDATLTKIRSCLTGANLNRLTLFQFATKDDGFGLGIVDYLDITNSGVCESAVFGQRFSSVAAVSEKFRSELSANGFTMEDCEVMHLPSAECAVIIPVFGRPLRIKIREGETVEAMVGRYEFDLPRIVYWMRLVDLVPDIDHDKVSAGHSYWNSAKSQLVLPCTIYTFTWGGYGL